MGKDRKLVKAEAGELTIISGRVGGNGAGAPVLLKGKGFTVADGGAVGKYNIVFDNAYDNMYACPVAIGSSNPDVVKGFTAHTVGISSRTVAVWIYNAAQALADLASTDFIDFNAMFVKTSRP
jgi:hypothetical protein